MRRVAMLAVVAAALGLGACGGADARPAGITERWLQAVSLGGRDGLVEESAEQVAKYAEPGVEASLLAPDAATDDDRFPDLEVGAAVVEGDFARVPFRVTRRLAGDERDEVTGTALLTRTADSWEVMVVEPANEALQVPSAGGDRPARAQGRHWAAAVAIGAIITVLAALLIEAQPQFAIARD